MDDGEVTPEGDAVAALGSAPDSDSMGNLLRHLARTPEVSAVPAVAVGDTADGVHLPASGETTPKAIGGFEIVRTLGAGGMGVVFEAIDPTLKRKIAIKLLRSRRVGAEGTARMLREAQALAKLSHPNVVTAYGAGVEGDRVYLAMELVTGVTARAWVAAQMRSIREILDVYRQAANGLAAAHEAGLVHRDIKPDNILVGADGRVRITDFGLVGEADSSPPVVTEAAIGTDVSLTATGTVLGTLPYIAPEAHRSEPIGPRADQWSLCVALWESIAGMRPHTAATQRELVDAVLAGHLVERPHHMTSALRAVLARGLATDPAARWPSLAALFAALNRAHQSRRRWLVAGVAGIAMLGTVGLAFATSHRTSSPVAKQPTATHPAATRTPIAQLLATPDQVCPYMPSFVDGNTLVFGGIGTGDLFTLPATGGAPPHRIPQDLMAYRVARGRRPGEAVYVSIEGDASQAAFVDVATGATERMKFVSSSYAVGGGALFYLRTEVPEIRRVLNGADEPAVTLPAGRWPYTVASTPDGTRLVITTSYDRSRPMICIADLDPTTHIASAPATCLEDHLDAILGRAAFSPDGKVLYYQTSGGIRRREGTNDTLWIPDVQAVGGIDVSPDGRSLVYSDTHVPVTSVVPAGTSGPSILDGDYGNITALAGGRWLYTRDHENGDDLVLREPDGSTRVVIPPGIGKLASLAPDAAGERVVVDIDGGEAPGIYVVDVKPWPPVRITTDPADTSPIWTADGKIAFTRWDSHNQPSVIIVDPADGIRADAARRSTHPLPRTTAASLASTGELVLLSVDAHAIYLWNPKTDRERHIDVSETGKLVWLITPSHDGTELAVLFSDYSVWRVPVPQGASDHRALRKASDLASCVTGGIPIYDDKDQLYVIRRPWLGSIHRIEL